MKKGCLCSFVAVGVLVSSTLVLAVDKKVDNPIVAQIGKETVITLRDFNNRLQLIPSQYQSYLSTRENRLKVLSQMIDEKLLLSEARLEGIAKMPEYKTQVEANSQQLLINMLLQSKVDKKIKVTEDDAKAYYKNNADQFKATEERRARHILIKSENEANDILGQVRSGSDFAELAKKYSIDPSGKNGGELGWFSRGQLVPEFESAVYELKNKNDISNVVKTKFGFHIIQLEDINMRPKMEFADVKDQITRQLMAQSQQKLTANYLSSLRKLYNVKEMNSSIK